MRQSKCYKKTTISKQEIGLSGVNETPLHRRSPLFAMKYYHKVPSGQKVWYFPETDRLWSGRGGVRSIPQ